MGEEDMAGWKDYLGDKAFYKKILAIALPISAQQLITVGVNLMDTVMLSSMGDAQLSASALGGQFINLFQIFCMGLGSRFSAWALAWARRCSPPGTGGCGN